MNEVVHQYVESFLPPRNELLRKMERIAEKNNVPIMELMSLHVMLQFMRIQNPERILEIGTAIGYSALRMAYALPDTSIVTIELDEQRAEEALANIRLAGMENRITLLKGNALDLVDEVASYAPFDAIFIDAAKGQYMNFFNMYSTLLTNDGCVYSDNVLFKGLVANDHVENKRLEGIVKKLKEYNQSIMDKTDFITTIIPIGDGLAVSKKI
ncbi:putative O-methyltransferase YrrM [Bacillus thermophilus]|uniref:tRNA 5-hydroxyuridine methyltransferase n=1 Tax=Siminovitchia thermophila TaxID=1245522 RepID=A0ABS2RAW1_9BACI|nr:O-methyltransferase [Siminovitchia thermophila]MBM7716495.1 putative O-methyltransferase YrrM [Siminovitchia thermophila]ONK24160.1 SAM-dependent methyltransferase [Bacillus sp. VT-16-64]